MKLKLVILACFLALAFEVGRTVANTRSRLSDVMAVALSSAESK